MINVKLTVNGKDFPIHYRLLSAVANDLPDEPQYAALTQELLALDIPSITEKLLARRVLTNEDRDSIWRNGNLHLKRLLAGVEAFRRNLTDAQAEEIITLNNRKILQILASCAEDLYPDPEEKKPMRMSGKMADTLLNFIFHHRDSEVRRMLAENPNTPAKFKRENGEKYIHRRDRGHPL